MLYKFNKFIAGAALCLALGTSLEAANCNNRAFSIKVLEDITIREILEQLSNECEFSIAVKGNDAEAVKVLDQSVSNINIKNQHLHEIFGILLSQNDLNYSFKRNVLNISSIDTKIFKIDYITSIREGRSVIKASADSAPVQLDDLADQNQNTDAKNQDNIIETTEKFDFWTQIATEIEAIINNGKETFKAPAPVVNSNAGLVSVTGTKGQLDRVEEYIQKLNRSLKKQVMIDVRIVEVGLNSGFSRGVDWSKFSLGFNTYLGDNPYDPITGKAAINAPTSSYSFGRWKNGSWDVTTPSTSRINGGFILRGAINLNLDGVINFLDTTGSTRVVSSPKIMTMNNQQAIISVGDNINYQITSTTYMGNNGAGDQNTAENVDQYSTFVGILLNLLPEISDDGKIMLRINPSLNTLKYEEDKIRQSTPRSIAPDTMQKKLSSVVQVNSGDTIVLGGLISQDSGDTVKKVPGLGDIPVLGYLFKNKTKSVSNVELVFIITPTIVDVDNTEGIKDSLKSLGFSDGVF